MTRKHKHDLLAWILPIALLLVWEASVRAQLFPPSQSAAPTQIAGNLIRLVGSGELLNHAMHSLGRLILGVMIGTLAGTAMSLWLAGDRTADRLVSPTVRVLAGVPAVAWMPFWIMVWGTSEVFKIAMAGITAFFLIHAHASHSIRAVGRPFVELAEMYEKTRWETIREVLIPSAVSTVITAVRVTFALGWIVIFFVEYASAERGSEGLGWFIADARGIGRVEDEFAGLVFLALIAYATDTLLAVVQRRMGAWSDTLEVAILKEAADGQ